MAASEVTVNAYILYAFMGVIVLLLIALLGAVFRMLYVMGGLKVKIAALVARRRRDKARNRRSQGAGCAVAGAGCREPGLALGPPPAH